MLQHSIKTHTKINFDLLPFKRGYVSHINSSPPPFRFIFAFTKSYRKHNKI